jgi:uncharacterized membrane protein YvlD (DUF360 family)
MSNNNSSSSSGIGFFGLLTILFITLKLIGYIDWSWWWVLAPLYMPITIFMIGFFIFVLYKIGVFSALANWISSPFRKRKKKQK